MEIASEMKQFLNLYSESLKHFTLCIVCNKKSGLSSSIEKSSEYFSDDEFEEIVSMFSTLDMEMEFFLNEDDFIKFILKDQSSRRFVVYNAAQSGNGPGRKSLIPAFCNLHEIPVAGSNAYVVALCRHKYHTNRLLSAANFPVPFSSVYTDKINDQYLPFENQKIILKPIYESASIGIDVNSIIIFTLEERIKELIKKKQESLKQPIMLQQFIDGYEVEIPVFSYRKRVVCFHPIGISLDSNYYMGDRILDYESVYFDRYNFYDFQTIDIPKEKLIKTAKEVTLYLGIEGLGRIDFRIGKKGDFYITDVSTNPHFVKHSSIHYAFKQSSMCENNIARAIVCGALSKMNIDYVSAQN